MDLLQKAFIGGNSYWLTRFVILRLLGFVYAVAFLVAAQQLVPLVGEHGLTPATHFLAAIESQLGSRAAGHSMAEHTEDALDAAAVFFSKLWRRSEMAPS